MKILSICRKTVICRRNRTQTTFRQMSQNFRPQQILQNRLSGMNPLHSNLFRAHHLLIILHRFSTKRVAFLRVKKRIHRRMRTVIPPPHRKPRRPHRHLTVLSTPRNALMHRYRSIWTKSLNRWKVKNEQTEPSCTNWMANLPSLTG